MGPAEREGGGRERGGVGGCCPEKGCRGDAEVENNNFVDVALSCAARSHSLANYYCSINPPLFATFSFHLTPHFLSNLSFFLFSLSVPLSPSTWVVHSQPASTARQRPVRTLSPHTPASLDALQAMTRLKTSSKRIACWPRTRSKCCCLERESRERSVIDLAIHSTHHIPLSSPQY